MSSGDREVILDGPDNNQRSRRFIEAYLRPCLAELVGTTLFVLVGCMCVQNGEVTSAALGHGLMIAIMIAGFGHISGGHFNPAVTLGVVIAGGIKPTLAIGYFLAQVIGGILGAACSRGVMRDETVVTSSVYWASLGGGQTLAPGVTPGEGILCELLLTAIVVSTVLMTAVDEDGRTSLAPLCIGLAVTADIVAGAHTTGASMNPARTLGPAVVLSYHSDVLWTYHYVYWVGPLLGAILAGTWYRLIFCTRDKRLYHINN